MIGAFLNKYGGDRKRLPITGYEFQVKGIYDVEVSERSINQLPDGTFQFNGSARIRQVDPASKVSTDVNANYYGVAFFTEGTKGVESLNHVVIDRIIQVKA